MFKVLNENGKFTKVEKIDVKKHKHLSGRDFTLEEINGKAENKKENKKEEIISIK